MSLLNCYNNKIENNKDVSDEKRNIEYLLLFLFGEDSQDEIYWHIICQLQKNEIVDTKILL